MKTLVEKATNWYNRICMDICWEHRTVNTEFSEGTEGWTLDDMYQEFKYLESCYHEDGNIRYIKAGGCVDAEQAERNRNQLARIQRWLAKYADACEAGINDNIAAIEADKADPTQIPEGEDTEYATAKKWFNVIIAELTWNYKGIDTDYNEETSEITLVDMFDEMRYLRSTYITPGADNYIEAGNGITEEQAKQNCKELSKICAWLNCYEDAYNDIKTAKIGEALAKALDAAWDEIEAEEAAGPETAPAAGTEERTEDMKSYSVNYYTPGNPGMIVIKAADEEEARWAAEKAFAEYGHKFESITEISDEEYDHYAETGTTALQAEEMPEAERLPHFLLRTRDELGICENILIRAESKEQAEAYAEAKLLTKPGYKYWHVNNLSQEDVQEYNECGYHAVQAEAVETPKVSLQAEIEKAEKAAAEKKRWMQNTDTTDYQHYLLYFEVPGGITNGRMMIWAADMEQARWFAAEKYLPQFGYKFKSIEWISKAETNMFYEQGVRIEWAEPMPEEERKPHYLLTSRDEDGFANLAMIRADSWKHAQWYAREVYLPQAGETYENMTELTREREMELYGQGWQAVQASPMPLQMQEEINTILTLAADIEYAAQHISDLQEELNEREEEKEAFTANDLVPYFHHSSWWDSCYQEFDPLETEIMNWKDEIRNMYRRFQPLAEEYEVDEQILIPKFYANGCEAYL